MLSLVLNGGIIAECGKRVANQSGGLDSESLARFAVWSIGSD